MEPTEPGVLPLQFERIIEPRIESLITLMDDMESFCSTAGVPETITVQLVLVLEELATNTIKYGYRHDAGGEIGVRVRIDGALVALEVSDDADAFDPTAAPIPDVQGALEERSIGGLGIHLVMRMMDTVAYQRRAGRNIVTVSKSFDAAAGQ